MSHLGNKMYIDNLDLLEKNIGVPIRLLYMEAMHLLILETLFSQKLSEKIAFQGGTSIHLLYGGDRFSEDLDFSCGDLKLEELYQLMKISNTMINKNIVQEFGKGSIKWKYPELNRASKVKKWWCIFSPEGTSSKIQVKMEFAFFPYYEKKILPVKSKVFPYRQPIVNGISPEELLCEKICALAGRSYLKGRDYFDIWYLTIVKNSPLKMDMIFKKFSDYEIVNPKRGLKKALEGCNKKFLSREMSVYLPQKNLRLFENTEYKEIIEAVSKIIKNIIEKL